MHEVAIALTIVDELAERARNERIAEITTVHIRVGAMTAVVPDALQFAWELATSGTPASGSTLYIERVPLAIACHTCDAERTIESGIIPVCPVCGTSSAEILHGRELQIVSMEVVYDAEAGGSSAEHFTQKHHART